MRRMMISAAAAAVCCMAQPARAQNVFPTILALPSSTVALSMGGAYPITSVQPDVVFHNPALIRNARGISISHQVYAGESSLTTFATPAATPLSFGVQVLEFGEPVAEFGKPAGVLVGDRSLAVPVSSTARAGEAEGVIAYARTVKGLRLGVAGKWVQHWSGGTSTGDAAFDVGAYANPIDFLSVGIVAQNLGDDRAGAPFDLPRRGQLTIATSSTELGPLDVMATGEMHIVSGGKTGGGIGAELSYWPFNGLTFALRGGARMGTTSLRVVIPGESMILIKQGVPTAGAGVRYKRFTFDYAFESFRGASASHRIGVLIN